MAGSIEHMFDVMERTRSRELRPAIDAFRADELQELPDALAEEDFAELWRAAELIELEKLRRLADLERRGLFARDGHLSVAAWLSQRYAVARGTAVGAIQVARALEEMPSTTEAVSEGLVSLSCARALVAARHADPEAFARDETMLVDAARIHPVADLQRVTTMWRQRVERERGLDPGEALRERRSLHASKTFGGMVRVDGDLDPETGETLLTALGAVVDAQARADREDRRSPAQRRADALGEICRQWLDLGERPTVAGERPHVTVTIDVGVLGSAGSGELDHTGPVPAEVVRRLACDASVMRVVMAGPSQPLDVGRRTPVVSPAIRRAVIARDGRCRFPGCDRPHTWCDAHHIRHWAHGGTTSVANLVLLCRHHHRAIHGRAGFRVAVEHDAPVFRRADGRVLEDRAPP